MTDSVLFMAWIHRKGIVFCHEEEFRRYVDNLGQICSPIPARGIMYSVVNTGVLHPDPLSLRQWAENHKIVYKTAWRMYKEGRLPKSLRVERLPTGTIRLYPASGAQDQVEVSENERAVIYARIHPRQKRTQLETQVTACKSFCHSKGWIISQVIREVAPTFGVKREKLKKLLESPPPRLVILNQTVLSRFDFEAISSCLARAGCRVTIIDESDEIDGSGALLEDLVDAISVTCRRHYGQKRGALLIEALVKLIQTKTL
jgi:putative resolvase